MNGFAALHILLRTCWLFSFIYSMGVHFILGKRRGSLHMIPGWGERVAYSPDVPATYLSPICLRAHPASSIEGREQTHGPLLPAGTICYTSCIYTPRVGRGYALWVARVVLPRHNLADQYKELLRVSFRICLRKCEQVEEGKSQIKFSALLDLRRIMQ